MKYYKFMHELKLWFSWYDNNDEIDHEQFLNDYFTHYNLITYN